MLIYRDLGGIKNRENKVLKNNMLIRSANLNKLNSFEVRRLKKHDLKSVIDLRTNTEMEEKPDIRINNVKYKNMPIFKEKTVGITHERENGRLEMLKNLSDISDVYKIMVTDEYSVLQLKKIINEIVNSDDNAILFHCTAGKDRTGIVAMLILYILDVDEQEIIKNFLEINKIQKYKANFYYHLISWKTKDKELAVKAKKYFLASEDYLRGAMQAINDKYGNIENFIKYELEITDTVKEKFKKKILR